MGEMNKIFDDAHFAYVVKTLVQQVPNDSQLGEEVRRLYWKAQNENS
jgi:hypothetical protein